jgi:hypothetical protein
MRQRRSTNQEICKYNIYFSKSSKKITELLLRSDKIKTLDLLDKWQTVLTNLEQQIKS